MQIAILFKQFNHFRFLGYLCQYPQLHLAVKSPEERAKVLFYQPFVVLSHGTQEDPILNYGNKAALALWEMTGEEFTSMPSSFTAEPINRTERSWLLSQVTRYGYINDYRGVRIPKSGRRFLVEQATVWNILDANGTAYDNWCELIKNIE
jgi:hypothetical protein